MTMTTPVHPDPASAYPAMMAYIAVGNTLPNAAAWCDRLRVDESKAAQGLFVDVAADMARAEADYAAAAVACGWDPYPFNSAMGKFLGLPLRSNNEPGHGYYMARQVSSYYRLGKARREAEALVAAGALLKIVAAKSKATGKPVRFHVFSGPDQIKIEGGDVVVNNGKRRGRLSSNWSVETCLQRLVTALETGAAYGT